MSIGSCTGHRKIPEPLELFWPLLRAMINGENHDAIMADGVRRDKWRTSDNEFPSTSHSPHPSGHGEYVKLLHTADNPRGNVLSNA